MLRNRHRAVLARSEVSYEKPEMEMTSVEYEGGVQQLNLSGRLDLAGSRVLDAALNQLTLRKNLMLIINLTDIDFIASIGIRSFMMAAKTIKNRKGALVLMSPQPLVAEVLTRTNVQSVIPICDGLENSWKQVWEIAGTEVYDPFV